MKRRWLVLALALVPFVAIGQTPQPGLSEDRASASGDAGTQLLAIRQSTPANTSGTNGDYEPLQVNGGLLWTQLGNAQTPTGGSLIDDVNDGLRVALVATGAVPVTDNSGSLTVDGTLTCNAGSGTLSVDTEAPAAAALADATSNPTTPSLGAYNFGFNGTTWDRLRSDTSFGLDVDVTRVPSNMSMNLAQIAGTTTLTGNGATGAGSPRVTIASDNTAFTVNAAQATASSLNAEVQGDAATDAAVTGNPLLSGARASTAVPTAMSADGDAVPLWANRNGALKGVLVDDAGDSVMDGTNNAVNVSVVSGGGGGTQYDEDTASASGDKLTMCGAVRNDAGTALTSADGDRGTIRVTSAGELVTHVLSIQATGSATSLAKAEDAAAASGDINVAVMGQRKESTAQLTSADGDYGMLTTDAYGMLRVTGDHPNRFHCVIDAQTTDQQCQAAPGAGLSLYITSVHLMLVPNATANNVRVVSGTGTACATGLASVGFRVYSPASATSAPAGTDASLPVPIKLPANTAACFDTSVAAGGYGGNIEGFIAP